MEKFKEKNQARKQGAERARAQGLSNEQIRYARWARQHRTPHLLGEEYLGKPTQGAFGEAKPEKYNELVVGTTGLSRELTEEDIS